MSTEKETTFCTHKGYNTVAPCDDSCFSQHSQSESIEWEKEEWGGWKIVSDMLDHPDENGIYPTGECYKKLYDFVVSQKKKAIASAVAKDRELGNPYNSVSTWKEIGKNRGYWDFFKDQVISAREKELVEEVEKKSFRGFAPYEQDYLIKKEDVLSILKH